MHLKSLEWDLIKRPFGLKKWRGGILMEGREMDVRGDILIKYRVNYTPLPSKMYELHSPPSLC